MEQSPQQNRDAPAVQGQSVDQVNSEITEILKLERTQAEDLPGRCDLKMELIKKYIRAIQNIAGVKRWPDNHPTLARLKTLHREFRDCEKEEIIIYREIMNGEYVNVMTIESDERTLKIVPDTGYQSTYAMMQQDILVRWLTRLSKIAQELAELLAPEINLHKDLAHNRTDLQTLKDMAATRGTA